MPPRPQSVARDRLRRRLSSAAPLMYPVASCHQAAPGPPVCAVCRGPVRPGFARCYQCERQRALGRRLLADAVVPVSYAIRGTSLADDLWRCKSRLAPAVSSRASVLALLLVFLADHGACVWRHAGMPAPGQLAVVPAGSGRPGPHPLLQLVAPFLRLPVCGLAIRPGRQGRDLDPGRFRVAGQVRPGASVLLLDDTWVSGASAQSAAAALRLAGARHVAVVVAGRHVNPGDPQAGPLAAGLAPARYDPSSCAVHPSHPGLKQLLYLSIKCERELSSEIT
jgi:hypothetical protein